MVREVINSVENNRTESISDSNFIVIAVDSLYELSIPKYMKKMTSLNEEASLQYANFYKEAYTIVINENKQDFANTFKEYSEYNDSIPLIENYARAQQGMFKESMDVKQIMPYGLVKINNYNARQVKITGNVDGQDIGYIIAFIEGNDDVYMIMNWTLLDRLKRFENTFEVINSSFKLIDKKED
ncbi:MAG: hypothetical protein KDC69_06525 [Flavobacteriaceae bacterium]|nr:hypothetical protein [Flavobacteriaceae bacterium]